MRFNSDPPLLSAARHDSFGILTRLLELGEDPNQTNSMAETALILAVQRGFEKAVEQLLRAGANALHFGGDVSTMRNCAAGLAPYLGHHNIIKMVLESIELNTFDKIVHYRCYAGLAGQNGFIDLLDDSLLKVEDVCCQPTCLDVLPPLIQSIYRDDLSSFRELLAKGADPHQTLNNGLAPLHVAIRLHRHEIFDMLMEHQVDINQRESAYLYSPLFVAVKEQNRLAYRKLIELGALDLPTEFHHTALCAAVYLNDMPVIQELIARGSDLTQFAGDGYRTLVYIAARYGHHDVLKYLLSLGLEPDRRPDSKDMVNYSMVSGLQLTALTAAISNCDLEAVDVLLKAGADPNRKSCGVPPLHFAVPRYHFPESETIDYQALLRRYRTIIDRLIENGGDVNLNSDDGYSFLTKAILARQEEIAMHLIESGACFDQQDKYKKLPIDYAKEQKLDLLVSYLTKASIEQAKLTAREMQNEFIQIYLNPTLQRWHYKNHKETWWNEKGDFALVIHLQSYPWNEENSIDFTFNIGFAHKQNLNKEFTYFDMSMHCPEAVLLPEDRQKHPHKNNIGYSITDRTKLSEFIQDFQIDFEKEILPRLDRLSTFDECLTFFRSIQA